MFRKTIHAETVIFAVVQLIRGACFAVIKQYSHFYILRFLDFEGQRAFFKITEKTRTDK